MTFSEYAASFLASAQNNIDAFGLIGLALVVASTQMRARTLLLGTSMGAAGCWSAHYANLGSLTASAMCGLAVFQGLIAAAFIRDDERPAWVVGLFGLCLMIGFAAAGATWNGYASLFAAFGSVFATAARLQTSVRTMRALFLLMTLCWWAHDAVMQTPLALACETFAVLGFIVAMLRDALSTHRTKAC